MKDSNKLRNDVIYQVFVRQHGIHHDFSDVKADLNRIKDLGVDIIYLMPIFPIGKINRKGTYGSPYSIYDYNQIDEFLGGKEKLLDLINECHKLNLKIIVDLALNHTSCDATLLSKNEKYYYHLNGEVGRKCADWSDVLDLNYDNLDLYPEIINSVSNLLRLGFDGFRMDVCSLIPMKFWNELYKKLILINPDVIMVGESVHPQFRDYIRTLNVDAPSDLELYDVFDVLYQYDIDDSLVKLRESHGKEVSNYILAVYNQNKYYAKPKLRYLENHDTSRIASHVTNKLNVLHAINYFLPGLTFIYAGEEYKIDKRPDLFELDPIDFKNVKGDYSLLFKRMAAIRKMDYFYINDFEIVKNNTNLFVLRYKKEDKSLYGIFNFSDNISKVKLEVKSGKYLNLFNNEYFTIDDSIDIKDFIIFEA